MIARRRRFDSRVKDVRAALDDADKTRVPDAVAGALDALYDLWEYWQQRAAHTMNQADERVRGDTAGEAGSPRARPGSEDDVLEEFGRLTDTYGDTYRDYWGVWRWQDYSDPRPRFATRDGLYARHVARHEVLPPLEAGPSLDERPARTPVSTTSWHGRMTCEQSVIASPWPSARSSAVLLAWGTSRHQFDSRAWRAVLCISQRERSGSRRTRAMGVGPA